MSRLRALWRSLYVRRQLRVATDETLETADDVRDALLAEAQRLADEDVALNRRMK